MANYLMGKLQVIPATSQLAVYIILFIVIYVQTTKYTAHWNNYLDFNSYVFTIDILLGILTVKT